LQSRDEKTLVAEQMRLCRKPLQCDSGRKRRAVNGGSGAKAESFRKINVHGTKPLPDSLLE
jgi:hypothetical protein